MKLIHRITIQVVFVRRGAKVSRILFYRKVKVFCHIHVHIHLQYFVISVIFIFLPPLHWCTMSLSLLQWDVLCSLVLCLSKLLIMLLLLLCGSSSPCKVLCWVVIADILMLSDLLSCNFVGDFALVMVSFYPSLLRYSTIGNSWMFMYALYLGQQISSTLCVNDVNSQLRYWSDWKGTCAVRNQIIETDL